MVPDSYCMEIEFCCILALYKLALMSGRLKSPRESPLTFGIDGHLAQVVLPDHGSQGLAEDNTRYLEMFVACGLSEWTSIFYTMCHSSMVKNRKESLRWKNL